MRREVLLMTNKDFIIEPWTEMLGVSIKDWMNFLKMVKKEYIIFLDIDPSKTFKKAKKWKKKYLYIKFKKVDICWGTYVLLSIDEKYLNEFLNLSQWEIFEINNHPILEKINFYITIHDFDWSTMFYFKDKALHNKLLEFINKKTKLIESIDKNDFQ